MSAKKILYVATVVKTHIMEFHIPYLKMLKEEGWETAVAARNDYENPADCMIPYCDKYFDIAFERNPFRPQNLSAYKQLKEIIDREGYDIVHCHTPVGGVLGRLASIAARKKGTKVIYTAHGFHFYKGAPLVNWLLYYPVERWLAKYTDVLITINKEDYARAQKFKAKKVCHVPGVGIDFERFYPNQKKREKTRAALKIKEDDFALLSVGELIKRKNHDIILDAIASIKRNRSELYQRIRYFVCGRGVLETKLKQKAVDLGIEGHVTFLGFRSDMPEIYNAADLFVFMSYQEGLPVALMEAIACGLPVVCSKIRGNIDLLKPDVHRIFASNDAESISADVIKIMLNIVNPDGRNHVVMKQDGQFELRNILLEVANIYNTLMDSASIKPQLCLENSNDEKG